MRKVCSCAAGEYTTTKPTSTTTTVTTVYYANCEAARKANASHIPAGEPGYRPELDGDQDGIACDDKDGVYYASCADALAAGASHIAKGEPGYRAALDGDND